MTERPNCHKFPYLTRGEARHARRSDSRSGKDLKGLGIYVCPNCGYWHLGHEKVKAKTQKVPA